MVCLCCFISTTLGRTWVIWKEGIRVRSNVGIFRRLVPFFRYFDYFFNKVSILGYIKRRSKTHHAALRVFHSDNPHPQEEYLDSLWQQIKRLRSEMWIEKHIIRPYLAFDSVLCEALQHNLPPMVRWLGWTLTFGRI